MTQISGTAADVPFIAIPPDGSPDTAAPAVILWHLLGAPGTPAAMAASLPLAEVLASRIYLELPGTGMRVGTHTGSDLLVDAYAPIPIAATAVINPAVRAESVMAVNERAGGIEYHWNEESRAVAERLDLLAAEFPEIPLLLITGAEEYPEFQPDQKALHETLADRGIPVRHRIIDGLAHMFAEQPGLPPTPDVHEIDREIAAWLQKYAAGKS